MVMAEGYVGADYRFSLTSANRNVVVVELSMRCVKRDRGQYGLRISPTDFGFPGGTTYKHNYCRAVVSPNALCTMGFILITSCMTELLWTTEIYIKRQEHKMQEPA
jgi:hypothetical protein